MKIPQKKIDKMSEYGIPEYMQQGIIYYYEEGLPPGDFLSAVIDNDLKEAIGRADTTNVNCLKAYIMWFYNQAPRGSWGYAGAVKAWLKKFEKEKEKENTSAVGRK